MRIPPSLSVIHQSQQLTHIQSCPSSDVVHPSHFQSAPCSTTRHVPLYNLLSWPSSFFLVICPKYVSSIYVTQLLRTHRLSQIGERDVEFAILKFSWCP